MDVESVAACGGRGYPSYQSHIAAISAAHRKKKNLTIFGLWRGVGSAPFLLYFWGKNSIFDTSFPLRKPKKDETFSSLPKSS